MTGVAAVLPPGTTRGRVARAALGALRCLHPDPARRADPGTVYESLLGRYPYRWWLRAQRRRRGSRRGAAPSELGITVDRPGAVGTWEPDAGEVLERALAAGPGAVVFHRDTTSAPGTVRVAATPGPVAWFATGEVLGPVARRRADPVPGHWSAVGRVDEVLCHTGEPRARPQLRTPAQSAADIAVVVPSAGNTGMLGRFFEGLRREERVTEVVVVDNSPEAPDTTRFYDRWSSRLPLRVLRTDPDEEFNYSRANNLGARASTASVLAFCNDDLEFIDHPSLARLAGWLDLGELGVAGPQLRYPDGTIQHGGVVLGLNGLAEHAFTGMAPGSETLIGNTDDPRDVSAVTGACLVTARSVFDEVGGFDEELRLTGSDVWYCLGAAALGAHCAYDGTVALVHHESVSRRADNPLVDVVGSAKRWGHLVRRGDPYWSQRLAIHRHEPTLRRPGDPTSASMLLTHLVEREAAPAEVQRVAELLGGGEAAAGQR